MPIELEIKLRVAEFEPLRAALAAVGAEPVSAGLEWNCLLDDADGTLRRGDRGLRVRRFSDDGAGASRTTLTFKGPRDGAGIKSRAETETEVADVDALLEILAALGLKPCLVFEKRRETWRFEDCEVCLDELPSLGCFVEIEGPDRTAIDRARRALSLVDAPLVANTYPALVETHVSPNRAGIRELLFVAETENP